VLAGDCRGNPRRQFWGAHAPSRAAAGALAGGSSVLNCESWIWKKCSARAPNTAREGARTPVAGCALPGNEMLSRRLLATKSVSEPGQTVNRGNEPGAYKPLRTDQKAHARLRRREASAPEDKIQAGYAIADALDQISSSFCARAKVK